MVREDIKSFLSTIPNNVTVVAASKYADANDIRTLYDAGITNFGENRVDAFLEKYDSLQSLKLSWHFIGHLQRNKAHKVINKIDCLHSLDSLLLAEKINVLRETPLDCFIEVSVNNEESKNGVKMECVLNSVKECLKYEKIHLVGLMMMAVKNAASDSLDEQFEKLHLLRNEIEEKLHISLPYLSMGMSDDYLIALKHHATHIRLGRILFK
ncbi:MAG: YggS family pyridoxal phosphate-dependent enzyme [Bacilli bacterium]|nr:YggS family pyridoxal phosphate-dependent enzyme [Bacilli bacterium]